MTGQLFLDMDGVLADFDRGYEIAFGVRPSKADDNVNWEWVRARPGFYEGLPPMPDLDELWFAVEMHRPIVLTGVPRLVPEAPDNKKAWVRKNLGAHVEVRCCASKEKYMHARPGDILIDDWVKYKHLWVSAGGRWITHTSARESIAQLAEVMA